MSGATLGRAGGQSDVQVGEVDAVEVVEGAS